MEMRMTRVGEAVTYSFEFFPPKNQEGETRLWSAITALEPIAPDFISVTYGAGGSTRDRTIRITSEITEHTKLPVVAHLTCVGSTRDELVEILTRYKAAGIQNILALRGDPTGGPRAPWSPTPGGLNHADELVSLAADFGGFTIGVAAFPDGHPASNGDFAADIETLIRKEAAGATFATTQFFFEVDKWKALVDKLSARGSQLPIIAGILPVTNVKQVKHFAKMCGTKIPRWLSDILIGLDEKDETRKLIAAIVAVEQCRLLHNGGVNDFHFYTLNRAELTSAICHVLGAR